MHAQRVKEPSEDEIITVEQEEIKEDTKKRSKSMHKREKRNGKPTKKKEEPKKKETEKKGQLLFTRTKHLRLFKLDTSEWAKKKTIKWILTKILLSITVLGLGIYTAKTSLSLIQDYAQSPTSYTQDTLSNESITLPLSKICLPLTIYELDDVWKDLQNSSLKDPTHYQEKIILHFASKVPTKEHLLNEKWPNFLLFVVHYYLNMTMQYEALFGEEVQHNQLYTLSSQLRAQYRGRTIQQLDALSILFNDLRTSLNILDDQLAALNISINELKYKYGSEIKNLTDLTIVYHNKFSTKVMKAEVDSYLYSFDVDSVCYIARFDLHPLKMGESIQIQSQRWYLPNGRHDPNLLVSLGIGGKLTYGRHNVLLFNLVKITNILVVPLQVSIAYRSLPYIGGEKRCDESKSFDECIFQCRKNYFLTQCGCIPTFGLSVATFNESICNIQNYTNCFTEENMSRDQEARSHLIQCEENCILYDVCERFVYSQQNIPYREQGELEQEICAPTCYSTVELAAASFRYPIFEETFEWTLPSFIGALGGALGLWLGINVLDKVIYAIRGIDIVIKIRKKKAVDKAVAKTVSNVTENSNANNHISEHNTTASWRRYVRF